MPVINKALCPLSGLVPGVSGSRIIIIVLTMIMAIIIFEYYNGGMPRSA